MLQPEGHQSIKLIGLNLPISVFPQLGLQTQLQHLAFYMSAGGSTEVLTLMQQAFYGLEPPPQPQDFTVWNAKQLVTLAQGFTPMM